MASVTPMGQNPDPTYRIAKHHVGTRLISARCLPLLNTAPSWYTRWKFFFLESAIPVKVALHFSGANFVSLNFIDYVSMALCMGDNRVGDTSDLLDLPQEVGLGRRGSF